MLHSVELSRTQEILSRFRPIAPKPSLPQPPLVPQSSSLEIHLRRRPCRGRKRRRPSPAPLPLCKQQKPFLPILPSAAAVAPVEQDPLQEPRVIVPLPVRPVASTINVSCISDVRTGLCPKLPIKSLAEEVEEELESDDLPAVISDSRNRVRLANSAYKEMVGQPECPWLDTMMAASSGGAGERRPRRISGEVVLEVEEPAALPKSSIGFSCRAKIEWASDGERKYVEAPCEVTPLLCSSKDYCLAWRFITP